MNGLLPKVYPLLLEAIESGVAYGYRRAYKHDDSPTEGEICMAIQDAVIQAVLERFHIPVVEE